MVPDSPLLHSLPTEVHVWLADPDERMDAAQLERLAMVLDPEERGRHRRFRFERDRRLFLVAHALLRTTLSRYRETPPAAWRFGTGAHGRPEIAEPAPGPLLRFSLSHARGLAACAVTLDCDVGIDVEISKPMDDLSSLARQALTAEERRALEALPAAERAASFLVSWTLKEAYGKARGLGLSLPLGSFGFAIEGRGGDRIRLLPPPDDRGDAWQFRISRPTAEHQLALAIRCGRGAERSIRYRSISFSAAAVTS
jgi:4'-phosphopantetheinyl transferase